MLTVLIINTHKLAIAMLNPTANKCSSFVWTILLFLFHFNIKQLFFFQKYMYIQRHLFCQVTKYTPLNLPGSAMNIILLLGWLEFMNLMRLCLVSETVVSLLPGTS